MPTQREPKLIPFTSSTPADIAAAKTPPRMFQSAARTTAGMSLLYQTGLHVFSAEPGTGKSMVTLWMCHEHIQASPDNHVVLIDFEMSATVIARRMLQFGADPDRWRKQLHEYRPLDDINFTTDKGSPQQRVQWFFGDLLNTIKVQGYTNLLVVIDGLANALSSFGLNEIDNADVAVWNAGIGRLAPELECPVLTVDHMPKNSGHGRDSDRRNPAASRGASAKGAQADVVYSLFDTKNLPRQGRAGEVSLKLGKDRHSALDVPKDGLFIKFQPVDRQYHDAYSGGVQITFDDSPAVGLAFTKYEDILDAIKDAGGSAGKTDIRKFKGAHGKQLFGEKTDEMNWHLDIGVEAGLLDVAGGQYVVLDTANLHVAAERLANSKRAAESPRIKKEQDDSAF
jgi:predicted peroxiredoxin